MSETTFTFRVDDALKNDFAAAAKSLDRKGAQLLRDFMRDFVRQQQEASAYDAWYRRQIEIGQASANAGNLVSADQVEAKFLARREATLRRFEAK
ncbi:MULTISPECIES: CopG family ribbon-helix-helix protein [Photorhabdus]|uniref:YacA n=2 Tax=Photorhabdus TaxID=29487 RepID=A0A0F7LUP2_9GAMM|nr:MULTISPECIES: hypothetical protein [Photorhabdus]AKH65517.1 hypothetical protein VY86_21285 [Photorhabdus thracensis]EQC00787.1 hypothetical protein B738_09074 [Photorhabdus temperata subsp. temperata M1021]KER00962.1 putative transcriptional regulator [Photorhabdus temperata subsp. temperata Meg1]MCC8423244.1 hypothetical protein [Photorhabdus thracensis]MCT8349847.1 hypothetical protein [Photorhabdus temperata]